MIPLRVFFAAIAVLAGNSSALDCIQIPDNQIFSGNTVKIPAGANDTVEIPPNFSCTYNVKVPTMVYAHVRLENGLKGSNDLINVRDEQNTRTLISSRSNSIYEFYVFPNTTTTFNVVTKSVNMHSKFRLVITYASLLSPSVARLDNQNLRYFMLNDLQANSYNTPQTVVATETISVSIATSGWNYDVFDNFFLIEGNIHAPKQIYRMNQFVNQNYISSGPVLTVVGLDNRVSESSVVFSPLSQAMQYDSLTGFSTYFQANELNIDSTSGNKKKKAVNVISMTDGVMFLDVQKNPECSLKAVEAPPRDDSPAFLDFSGVFSYPRNLTQKSFSIIAENCRATLRMVSPSCC